MNVLMSIVIWVAGTIITALVLISSVLLYIIFYPFPRFRERIVHAQCFWWADSLIALNPAWELKVKGLENIDHKKTYVIVANHQSLGDIVVIYRTHMQFKWVAKKSLLKLPFIGGLLWINRHIMLSRGDFGSIKKVYREAAKKLRSNRSVLFFPEGTRTETDNMNEFQNGAFKLAIKEKVPLLPISISGTREAIPKGGWVFKTKVLGTLEVLPAIETKDLKPGDFRFLRDLVRSQLHERLLRGEL
jgi:1-acyl-sn-glycerol-3-phosphate acyltransferase